jgi:hypothetical protein
MRFVVPVPSIYTRPNRRYFGRKRGVTWLNMINDQGAGLGGRSSPAPLFVKPRASVLDTRQQNWSVSPAWAG